MGRDDAFMDVAMTTGSMVEEALAAATCLRISLFRKEQPIVQVSFPAYAVANLADLVPYEVLPRVADHALDLEQLAATVAAQGCPPGEIFSLASDDEIVRAWME